MEALSKLIAPPTQAAADPYRPRGKGGVSETDGPDFSEQLNAKKRLLQVAGTPRGQHLSLSTPRDRLGAEAAFNEFIMAHGGGERGLDAVNALLDGTYDPKAFVNRDDSVKDAKDAHKKREAAKKKLLQASGTPRGTHLSMNTPRDEAAADAAFREFMEAHGNDENAVRALQQLLEGMSGSSTTDGPSAKEKQETAKKKLLEVAGTPRGTHLSMSTPRDRAAADKAFDDFMASHGGDAEAMLALQQLLGDFYIEADMANGQQVGTAKAQAAQTKAETDAARRKFHEELVAKENAMLMSSTDQGSLTARVADAFLLANGDNAEALEAFNEFMVLFGDGTAVPARAAQSKEAAKKKLLQVAGTPRGTHLAASTPRDQVAADKALEDFMAAHGDDEEALRALQDLLEDFWTKEDAAQGNKKGTSKRKAEEMLDAKEAARRRLLQAAGTPRGTHLSAETPANVAEADDAFMEFMAAHGGGETAVAAFNALFNGTYDPNDYIMTDKGGAREIQDAANKRDEAKKKLLEVAGTPRGKHLSQKEPQRPEDKEVVDQAFREFMDAHGDDEDALNALQELLEDFWVQGDSGPSREEKVDKAREKLLKVAGTPRGKHLSQATPRDKAAADQAFIEFMESHGDDEAAMQALAELLGDFWSMEDEANGDPPGTARAKAQEKRTVNGGGAGAGAAPGRSNGTAATNGARAGAGARAGTGGAKKPSPLVPHRSPPPEPAAARPRSAAGTRTTNAPSESADAKPRPSTGAGARAKSPAPATGAAARSKSSATGTGARSASPATGAGARSASPTTGAGARSASPASGGGARSGSPAPGAKAAARNGGGATGSAPARKPATSSVNGTRAR